MQVLAPEVLQPPQGCQISFTDWNQLVAFMTALCGIGVALQQGVTDALPPIQPLAVTFTGGMGISLGGANFANPQWALCQGLLCAVVAPVPFTVPNNTTGSTRQDAIVCQPTFTQITTVQRPVEQPDDSKPEENIPEVIQGLAFQYVTGPSGGGNPTIPSGWEYFATLAVPNGASSVNATELTINFPPMADPSGSTFSTDEFTVPSMGGTVAIPVGSVIGFEVGQFGQIGDPISGNVFVFQVQSITSGTLHVVALALLNGTVGTTLNGNAFVQPTGPIPVEETVVLTTFACPSSGSSVNVVLSANIQYPVGTVLLFGRGTLSGAQMLGLVTAQNADGVTVTVTKIGPPSGASNILAGSPCVIAPVTGQTFLTANITSPTPGTTATLSVADSAGFAIGTYGWALGRDGLAGVYFIVTSIPNATSLDVVLLSCFAGGPGLTVYLGGPVYASTQPPAFETTTQTSFSAPAQGSVVSFSVTSNVNFPVGSYVYISRVQPFETVGAYMIGQVTALNSNGLGMTVMCIQKDFADGGTVSEGALVVRLREVIVDKFQNWVPSTIKFTGTITDPGSGGSASVTFPVPFTTYYRLKITPYVASASTPYRYGVTANPLSGFTVALESAGGHGPLDYEAEGY